MGLWWCFALPSGLAEGGGGGCDVAVAGAVAAAVAVAVAGWVSVSCTCTLALALLHFALAGLAGTRARRSRVGRSSG